jgi:hypothetical protein
MLHHCGEFGKFQQAIFDLLQVRANGMLQSVPANVACVVETLLVVAVNCSRLIKEGIWYENETLNADEDLEECGLCGDPTGTRPRAE